MHAINEQLERAARSTHMSIDIENNNHMNTEKANGLFHRCSVADAWLMVNIFFFGKAIQVWLLFASGNMNDDVTRHLFSNTNQ